MTIKDVADLLFAARERIDFYWNFHVVVVIAVIGWLVSFKRTLTLPMKLLVSVAYVIAAVMNYVGLYGSYTFAEALRTDLLRMAATTPLSDTTLFLQQHSYGSQRLTALLIHLAASRNQGSGLLPYDLTETAGNVLYLLATFSGPTVAALIVTGMTEGRAGIKRLLKRIIQWRVAPQ